jgi:hypothetical protein
MYRDFTQGNLGIRVFDNECAVIERKPGVYGWVEDGERLPLPLAPGFEIVQTIPANRIGQAFRVYEGNHPDELRELLTRKATERKREA